MEYFSYVFFGTLSVSNVTDGVCSFVVFFSNFTQSTGAGKISFQPNRYDSY